MSPCRSPMPLSHADPRVAEAEWSWAKVERPEGIEPIVACLEGRCLSHSAKAA